MGRILSTSTRHFMIVWLEILAAMLAIIVILWAGLLFRLNQGPIPLDFISQPLQQSINEGLEHYEISIGSTRLVWGGYSTPIELQLRTVQVNEKDTGTPVLLVSGVGLDVSKRALLEGQISPKSLSFYDTALRFYRTETGEISLRMQAGDLAEGEIFEVPADIPDIAPERQDAFWRAFMQNMLDQKATQTGEKSKLHYLDTLRIINADLVFHDEIRQQDFMLKGVELNIKRNERALIGTMESRLRLFDAETPVRTNFHYSVENGVTRVLTRFRELSFTEAGAFLPPAMLKDYHLDGLMTGVVFMSFDSEFNPIRLRLNANAYDGSVMAEDLFDQPLRFDNLALKATYAYESREMAVESLDITTGPTRLSLAARYGFNQKTDLYDLAVSAGVSHLPIDDIDRFWPAALAPPARNWVTSNLSDGLVDSATLSLDARHNPDADLAVADRLELEDMGGEINFSAGSVRYLPDFPKITDVSGQAVYTESDFIIKTTGGVYEDISVPSSEVTIDGLAEGRSHIDISIDLEGGLSTALDLIDNEPFRFPSKMNLPVSDIEGGASAQLHFAFPLKRGLSPQDVDLTVKADLENVSWRNIIMGQDIGQGDMRLEIDRKNMIIDGTAEINDAPVDLNWISHFDNSRPFQARLEARTELNRDAIQSLIEQQPLQLDGDFPTDIVYTRYRDGRQTAEINADLTQSAFHIPQLKVQKMIGAEGYLGFTLALEDGQADEIHSIDFRTPELSFQGAVNLISSAQGVSWRSAALSNLRFQQNHLNLSVVRQPENQYAIDIKGEVLDVSSYLKASPVERRTHDRALSFDQPQQERAVLKVTGAVETLITSQQAPLKSAKLFLIRDRQGLIDRLELDAIAGKGQVYMRYKPDANGRHSLRVEADDAGAAFRSFNLTNSIRGGILIIDGQPVERGGLRDLQGRLQLSNFTVIEAPVLARLLNGLSLSGLQSLLSGEGLDFARLKANFLWDENHDVNGRMTRKMLHIQEGATSGASLGLTFDGRVDLIAGQIDSDGTLVPVSGLNKAVGDIPIIGDILTGGGKGVFAATYDIQGPLGGPTVTVNPLAALAPGILRTIFFEGELP